MGWMTNVSKRFIAAYQEGLQMSCPVHRAKEKAAERVQKRREQIRTVVAKRKGKIAH